jgi:hypothetical protein
MMRTALSKETPMYRLTTRVLLAVAIGAVGAVAAAGVYTEAHPAPDQS